MSCHSLVNSVVKMGTVAAAMAAAVLTGASAQAATSQATTASAHSPQIIGEFCSGDDDPAGYVMFTQTDSQGSQEAVQCYANAGTLTFPPGSYLEHVIKFYSGNNAGKFSYNDSIGCHVMSFGKNTARTYTPPAGIEVISLTIN